MCKGVERRQERNDAVGGMRWPEDRSEMRKRRCSMLWRSEDAGQKE